MTDKTKSPYLSTLRDFEKKKILYREDIYGSGPPVDDVSKEALLLIKKFSVKSIFDVGCGTGAYMKRLVKKGYICHGIENNLERVKILTYGHFAPWVTEKKMYMHIMVIVYK